MTSLQLDRLVMSWRIDEERNAIFQLDSLQLRVTKHLNMSTFVEYSSKIF